MAILQLSGLGKLLDFYLIVAFAWAAAAWRWGDWRNWRVYYPTMLFMALGAVTYSLLTYNFPLWQFESPLLKTTGSDLSAAFLGFPSAVLLYLTYFPEGIYRRVVYILAWIASFFFIEWLSFKLGYLSYQNGWNMMWSLAFDCIMFPILWLHFKRPLWAVTLSFAVAAFFLVYFKVPFSSMK